MEEREIEKMPARTGRYAAVMAEAARLPKEVIDRYVVAKWNAQQASQDAYKALKGEWKSMINLLIDKGARAMADKSLRELLDSIASQYPEFLVKESSV